MLAGNFHLKNILNKMYLRTSNIDAFSEDIMADLIRNSDQNALPNLLRAFSGENWPDTIPAWAELYFRFEVTTSERSQKEQQRDFRLFHAFLLREAGSDDADTVDARGCRGPSWTRSGAK